ncbi:MAG: hypothetical protein KatS3mg077_3045 [Candidatus Binatia bacterium]|nr:MAG: hypothetical protein KatS3mg077_3045 [Candidatus Binatia bacterium]
MMAFVLYALAVSGLLRVLWVLGGGCFGLPEFAPACPAPLDTTATSVIVAEVGLSIVFLCSARQPGAHRPVLWAALVVLCGRAIVDFYGALTFPPRAAMALLFEMVVVLALLAGWLRAIPETLRGSPGTETGRGPRADSVR